MALTRRQLAVGEKAEQSRSGKPAYGSSNYVRDQLDVESREWRGVQSEALAKRMRDAQAEHFGFPADTP